MLFWSKVNRLAAILKNYFQENVTLQIENYDILAHTLLILIIFGLLDS